VDKVSPRQWAATRSKLNRGSFEKPLLLSWIARIETVVWLGIASFTVVQDQRDSVFVASPFVFALTWLFATVRPIVRPTPTPPLDLFTLYLIHELVSLASAHSPITSTPMTHLLDHIFVGVAVSEARQRLGRHSPPEPAGMSDI
jgi:hypothetical protein